MSLATALERLAYRRRPLGCLDAGPALNLLYASIHERRKGISARSRLSRK
jgi:hypothetical protein